MATLGEVLNHKKPPLLPTLNTTSVFKNWKFRILLFLEQKRIHDVLVVKVNKLRRKEDLKRKDAEARLWIVHSVDDELLAVVRKCKTAREMIVKLEAWFQRKTVFTKYVLKKKLLGMKFKTSDSLQEHFEQFDQLITNLEETGCKLEESDKVCHLLLTLPEEYNLITTTLDSVMSLSESENMLEFVKTHISNTVMGARAAQTTGDYEYEAASFNTTQYRDQGVDNKITEQYQTHRSIVHSNSIDVDQQCSEPVSIGIINPLAAYTAPCSPEVHPQAVALEQCPDSSEIKLSLDLNIDDEVADSTARVDPLDSSISLAYKSELQPDIFDQNSLDYNSVKMEPGDTDTVAEDSPEFSAAEVGQELEPAAPRGCSSPISACPGQDSGPGTSSSVSPESLQDEPAEDACTSDVMCCRVVLHDAANRLWCACCGQWCLSDAELQRHKHMHATPHTLAVDHSIPQSTSDTLTVERELLPTDSQEGLITDTSLEQRMNHTDPENNPDVPQTESINLQSSHADNTENSNVTLDPSGHLDSPDDDCKVLQTECVNLQNTLTDNASSCDQSGTSLCNPQIAQNTTIPQRCPSTVENAFQAKAMLSKNDYLEKNYICDTCGKRFKQPSRLKKHMVMHTGAKPSTVENDYHAKAMLSKNDNLQKNYICDTCGKSFKQPSRLKKHRLTHTGAKPFSCHICYKSYTAKFSVKYHIRSSHTDDRPFSCKICGKCFTFVTLLNKHVKATHAEEKLYECNVCKQSFATKWYLKKHSEVHNTDRPYKCDVCDKSFKSQRILKSHKVVHSDDKNKYVCQVCGKCFLRKLSLDIHKSVHGPKKYICDDCGASFSRKKSMISHLSIHNTDKQFKCKICKKRFSRQVYLYRHKLTHGERKYSCDICGQRFFYKSTLNRHMKAPHSEIGGPRPDRPPRK